MVTRALSSGVDNRVFSRSIWNGDPTGDMTLELEGCTWKVKKEIVSAQFPWIQNALSTAVPYKGSHVVIRPKTSNTTRPKVFSAILQFIHTDELPSQLWEDEPSFFTYVEFYFLAERFDIDRLQHTMVQCVEDLSWHVLSLAEAHCSHCPLARVDVEWLEKKHLASFLDAVLVVEEKPWSAKIIKAMYDAGDRMKSRLARLAAFRDFAEKFPAGRSFARAIGAQCQ